jgi:hypothetical protein
MILDRAHTVRKREKYVFQYYCFSFTFFCAGIVYKGDGSWLLAGANSALDASDTPALAPSVRLGTGAQRDFACQQPDCMGVGGSSLLSIVSMAAGPDGSLYIGDYNLIRRVWPTGGSSGGGGRVETIFEFGPRQQSFLYSLATSPGEEGVYLTNSERYQVHHSLNPPLTPYHLLSNIRQYYICHVQSESPHPSSTILAAEGGHTNPSSSLFSTCKTTSDN